MISKWASERHDTEAVQNLRSVGTVRQIRHWGGVGCGVDTVELSQL